ncbi:copper amine oxidase [Streptomyces sp. NPDC059544]|uniref:copper amine oxidase n=1 Tax=Streptomyces sp. NPDC059544 TaxID=3346861 RepID=UPI0036C1C5F2
MDRNRLPGARRRNGRAGGPGAESPVRAGAASAAGSGSAGTGAEGVAPAVLAPGAAPVRTPRRAASVAAAAVLLGGALTAAGPTAAGAAPPPTGPTPPPAPGCSAPHRVTQELAGGTTWRMCWHYDSSAGLVLDDVSYQPRGEARPIRVLTSAKLAQVHVPYDDGQAEYDDITGFGFGYGLQNLKPAECPGGSIRSVKVPDTGRVDGLCVTTRSRGHAYRMAKDQGTGVWHEEGRDLLLYTVNKVSWYEYITEWRFSSDGTVSANVGATGSLSPGDYDAGDGRGWPVGKGAEDHAVSHSHNVFWRLNFGLDGGAGDRIEQYDSAVTPPPAQGSPTTRTTRTPVTRELAGDAEAMRWWRVVSAKGRNADGHARSWEIVPGPTTRHAGRPYTRHDVYFTQNRACEQFASNNTLDCGPNAPDSVDEWVNGERLVNPVVWVHIGFHHIARDEDQQPMPVHWQGFQLAPRDVTAMNPLTPAELADQNGAPPTGS